MEEFKAPDPTGFNPFRGPPRKREGVHDVSKRADLALTPGSDAQVVRALTALRVLMRKSGVNLAELQARLYETEMIDMLRGFAINESLPAPFRRDCAKDVLDRARGRPLVAARVELPPPAMVADENGYGEDVVDAVRSASDMEEFQRWLGSGKPVAEWPSDVRERYARDIEVLAN